MSKSVFSRSPADDIRECESNRHGETQHVLQASLGYFMTPLVDVALGLLVLKERLSRWQTVAITFVLIWLGLGCDSLDAWYRIRRTETRRQRCKPVGDSWPTDS